MTFLNKKEDVVDLKLTHFGKRLLATGKFKPVYYAFFDDNILYDVAYAGSGSEEQSKSEERIRDETPTLSTQYTFRGSELVELPGLQATAEKTEILQYPLGTSNYEERNAPAWKIKALHGEFTRTASMLTSSAHVATKEQRKSLRIPQIDADMIYKQHVFPNGLTGEENFKADDYVAVFEDSSAVVWEKPYILLEIEEKNSIFSRENFDIEVFEIFEKKEDKEQSDGSTLKDVIVKEELQSLTFLLDDFATPRAEHIGHYFDIMFDEEIEASRICPHLSPQSKKDIFADEQYDCEDYFAADAVSKDIYVDSGEFEEVCD